MTDSRPSYQAAQQLGTLAMRKAGNNSHAVPAGTAAGCNKLRVGCTDEAGMARHGSLFREYAIAAFQDVASARDDESALPVGSHPRLASVPADGRLVGKAVLLVALLATQCLPLRCSSVAVADASARGLSGSHGGPGCPKESLLACESVQRDA